MEGAAPPVRADQLLAHRDWVRRVARALVRDENAADDLEQDVWVEALERPPGSVRALGGWFTAALRHNLVDRVRSEGSRRRREEARARPEGVASAEELVAIAEAHKRVVVAVMDLPEPYRSTVLFRFFEDLAPGEVARRAGVPVETVRTRTRRALGILRERMGGEGDGGRRAFALALAPLLDARAGGAAGSAGGAAAAAAAGGLLMTKKATAVGALAILLLAGWGAFLAGGDGEQGRVAPGAGETAAAPRESRSPIDPPPTAPATSEPPGAPASPVRTRSLPGQVCDEAGAIVPGVRIHCLVGTGTEPFSGEVLADAAGSFTIEVPAELPCRLVARAETYEDSGCRVLPEYPKVGISLRGKQHLSGKVIDAETGNPVGDARVRILAGTAWKPPWRFFETSSGSDGSFKRDGLPPGKFLVAAGAGADGPHADYHESVVGPVDADSREVRIELRRAPAIAGIVLDDEGRPYKGRFTVWARGTPAGYSVQFTSAEGNRAGRFRLLRVEPGRYEVVVIPVPEGADSAPFTGPVIRNVPAGTEDLEFRLLRGVPLEVRVVDAEGNPRDQVGFRVFGRDGEELSAQIAGRHGTDGRFTTGPLDPGQEFDLLVQDHRAGPWSGALVRGVRPGAGEVKVVVKTSSPFRGVLLDAAGAPAGAGVPVTAQCLDLRAGGNGLTVTGYTVADGSFTVLGTGPAGELRFRLAAGGGTSRFAPVLVEGPFRTGDTGIEIRLPAAGERLEGILRLPEGTPAARRKLYANAVQEDDGGLVPPWYAESATDDEGRFRFDNLPRGRVDLLVLEKDTTLIRCGTFETPATQVQAVLPLR